MSSSLPQVTHDEIDAAIARAFARGLVPDGPDEPCRTSTALTDDVLAERIMGSASAAMARLLRAQNARNSLYHHVPAEIWCRIWAFLPFSDRVAVSHTCSGWRAAAIGCCKLWTDLTFYVTAHAKSCQCADCRSDPEDPDDDPVPGGWARNPYPEDSSNFSLAPIVLPRSAGRPLFITVHIVACKERRGVMLDLASELRPHCHRVHELDVRAAQMITARIFMEDVGDWPALRHLTVGEEPNDVGWVEEGYPMLPGGIALPQLQSVDLVGNSLWPTPEWDQHYPSVQSVAIRVVDSVGFELLSILTSCQRLDSLDVDMEPVLEDLYDPFVSPELVQLALGLRSVRVQNLCANYEDYVMDLFNLPTRREIELEYYSRFHMSRGMRLFHDLGDGIHLRVECRDGMLSVRGTDANSRTRRVAVRFTDRPRPKDFSIIFSAETTQCLADVRSAAIDGSLWFHLIESMASYPSLVSLEIIIDNTTMPSVTGRTPRLPELQSLTLISYDGVVRLSAHMIAFFIRNLNLPLPIPILNVDHRLVPGLAASLRKVAQTINIGVYHVDF